MALENWWAAALTNVQAQPAKFRYGTLDLNAPSAIGIKWRGCGYIDTASVADTRPRRVKLLRLCLYAGHGMPANKVTAYKSLVMNLAFKLPRPKAEAFTKAINPASRRESQALSHF